jgi:hypothetical protein
MQPAAGEPLAVLQEKQPLGTSALHVLKQFADSARVRSDDASRQQIGKCERVLPPDLGIEKPRWFGSEKRINALWMSRREKLPEWRDSGRVGIAGYVAEPPDPGSSVIGGSVENGSSCRGKLGLEARYVVEVEPEDGQPVGEPIVGSAAECEDLFDPWAVAGKAEIVIEIMGHKIVGHPPGVQADFA